MRFWLYLLLKTTSALIQMCNCRTVLRSLLSLTHHIYAELGHLAHRVGHLPDAREGDGYQGPQHLQSIGTQQAAVAVLHRWVPQHAHPLLLLQDCSNLPFRGMLLTHQSLSH